MTAIARRITATVLVSLLGLSFTASPASAGRTLMNVQPKTRHQLEQLLKRGVEVVAYTRDGVDVLVDDRQLDYVLSQSYPVSTISWDGPALGAAALDSNLGMYHTYAEMESVIAHWDTTYSTIFDSFSLGLSVEGRTIHALKISDNVLVDEVEPEVLFIGNHHARELMSVEIPLRFAGYLLENYGLDPTVTGYVEGREIFFVPMMNPDGHVYVQNNHDAHWGVWWRKNRSYDVGTGTYGVDLNRNWGFEWGYDDVGSSPDPGNDLYRGPAPFSEPETQAVRDFVNTREFKIWLSYHSYGELLLFPWGYISEDTPEHEVFVTLGDTLTAVNDYLAGNSKSGAIYVVNGDSDDWGYGEQASKERIFAFTPELNSAEQGGFGPSDTMIAPTFDLNLHMNLSVLEYADDPYRVLGPSTPTQYAITTPYFNAVHELSWSPPDTADTNPTTYYEIESCENPAFSLDDGSLASWWDFGGFTLAPGRTGDGYYSGQGNNKDQQLSMAQPYEVDAASDTLTFWVEYDIEVDWDYGYVEVSADYGVNWASIPGNITTVSDPNGNNFGHGITGASGGWVEAIFPLTAYTGQTILVRVRYVTDQSVVEPGLTVDDIGPVATCATLATIAPVTGLEYEVTPSTVGVFRYRVRGVDDDDDRSRWSNPEGYTVGTLSAAGSPRRFRTRLGANFPNPFNPSTTIPYVVGGPSGAGGVAVSVRVYSVAGALVSTLVEGAQAPGDYEAVWDGTNDAGQHMASGIYFARLVVGAEAAATRKLVLVK